MWRVKMDTKFKNSFFPGRIYWNHNRIHLGFWESWFGPPPNINDPSPVDPSPINPSLNDSGPMFSQSKNICPHANEAAKYKKILKAIGPIFTWTLTEWWVESTNLSSCPFVITSRFQIWALYIIPGSRLTPHIIYCWAGDDVNNTDKDKTKTNTKCFKDPMYVIFLKSREFKDLKYDMDMNMSDMAVMDIKSWTWWTCPIANLVQSLDRRSDFPRVKLYFRNIFWQRKI